MGAETRIGIVTGLLIVVIASVYYFYSNDRAEDDLLLAPHLVKTPPPRIPGESAQKKAASSIASGGQVAVRPPRRRVGASDAVNRTASGRDTPRQRRAAARPKASSTTLYTEPSQALIEATQGNLAEAVGRNPSKSPGADQDPATVGEQPRRHGRGASVRRPGSGWHTARKRAVAAVPIPSWPKKHKIVRGDTLTAIATTYYGTSRRVADILQANPHITDAHRLKVGDVLILPAPDSPASAVVTPARGRETGRVAGGIKSRTYRTSEGESFFAIARKLYGDGSRWEEIYRLNRELVKNNPKGLRPGMVLALPE